MFNGMKNVNSEETSSGASPSLVRTIPGLPRLAAGWHGWARRHPVAAERLLLLLWGRDRQPAEYQLVGWLFLRLLAILYFSAFASMAVQIEGLVGADGILPIAKKLAAIDQALGSEKYWVFPTIFWFDASDTALTAVCYVGMVAAVLVLLNRTTRIALVVCFVLYLSVVYAGQLFMSFQWDFFLLESGFLAVFLTSGSRIIVLLYRLLLFRFMFMGGVVKLASGDPAWANLIALGYHYETQPLPSPLAWYAHHLPDWFHRICVGGVFFIELIVPFLVFLPRNPRLFAAWCFILLQGGIILTGNYNFFNLLTILLCLLLFEDRDIRRVMPGRLIRRIRAHSPMPGRASTATAGILAAFTLLMCGTYIWMYHSQLRPSMPLDALVHAALAFSLVNNYGPFAVMTTQRNEIIVEGSNDGTTWHAYGFKYKPDQTKKGLSWNIPHQPRLDWQMWFAALKRPHRHFWLVRFLDKLKEGSPPVLALLATNPFPDRPPAHVRAQFYRYRYTTPAMRTESGDIWQRQYLGPYWLPR